MNVELLLTFVVLAAVFACFVWERFPTELVALAGMGLVLVFGIIDESDLKVVFGNTAPVTIGAMFVLSEALKRTGAIDWLAQQFNRLAGNSLHMALIVLMAFVIPLSAFLNNTPVVIVFLPILMAYCRSSGVKASKLLIPLSFLSILGGTTTLIGTSTNLLVSGVAREAGQAPFGIFEITGLGAIYALIGSAYLFFFGKRLLPVRDTVSSLLDSEDTRSFSSAFHILPDSPLVGQKLLKIPAFADPQKVLIYEVVRDGRGIGDTPLDEIEAQPGDTVLFRSTSKQLAQIRNLTGIQIEDDKSGNVVGRAEIRTVEAIIGSRNSMIGQTLRDVGLRRNYGVVVAAIHRSGENIVDAYRDVPLLFGDTLLIEGPVSNLAKLQSDEDFLNLSESSARPFLKSRTIPAVLILAAVVIVAAFEWMSITSAALLGATLAILSGCVSTREAYRSIEWNILFLIYGMLALGRAMENTGGAEWLAGIAVESMRAFGPIAILAVIYLLASILTEFVTNNAVAILLTPIAISIATSLECDPRAFIVAVMFGASASFITPIGYQTNTYVYGAGGYRFGDFLQIGIPLNLILWITATLLIPRFWPL